MPILINLSSKIISIDKEISMISQIMQVDEDKLMILDQALNFYKERKKLKKTCIGIL